MLRAMICEGRCMRARYWKDKSQEHKRVEDVGGGICLHCFAELCGWLATMQRTKLKYMMLVEEDDCHARPPMQALCCIQLP